MARSREQYSWRGEPATWEQQAAQQSRETTYGFNADLSRRPRPPGLGNVEDPHPEFSWRSAVEELQCYFLTRMDLKEMYDAVREPSVRPDVEYALQLEYGNRIVDPGALLRGLLVKAPCRPLRANVLMPVLGVRAGEGGEVLVRLGLRFPPDEAEARQEPRKDAARSGAGGMEWQQPLSGEGGMEWEQPLSGLWPVGAEQEAAVKAMQGRALVEDDWLCLQALAQVAGPGSLAPVHPHVAAARRALLQALAAAASARRKASQAELLNKRSEDLGQQLAETRDALSLAVVDRDRDRLGDRLWEIDEMRNIVCLGLGELKGWDAEEEEAEGRLAAALEELRAAVAEAEAERAALEKKARSEVEAAAVAGAGLTREAAVGEAQEVGARARGSRGKEATRGSDEQTAQRRQQQQPSTAAYPEAAEAPPPPPSGPPPYASTIQAQQAPFASAPTATFAPVAAAAPTPPAAPAYPSQSHTIPSAGPGAWPQGASAPGPHPIAHAAPHPAYSGAPPPPAAPHPAAAAAASAYPAAPPPHPPAPAAGAGLHPPAAPPPAGMVWALQPAANLAASKVLAHMPPSGTPAAALIQLLVEQLAGQRVPAPEAAALVSALCACPPCAVPPELEARVRVLLAADAAGMAAHPALLAASAGHAAGLPPVVQPPQPSGTAAVGPAASGGVTAAVAAWPAEGVVGAGGPGMQGGGGGGGQGAVSAAGGAGAAAQGPGGADRGGGGGDAAARVEQWTAAFIGALEESMLLLLIHDALSDGGQGTRLDRMPPDERDRYHQLQKQERDARAALEAAGAWVPREEDVLPGVEARWERWQQGQGQGL